VEHTNELPDKLANKKENNMALKITHIDQDEVEGVLDGSLPFQVSRKPEGLTARIAGWKHERLEQLPKTMQSMRAAAYEILARYRESQRMNSFCE
jgi:hypothetical protein